MREMVSSPGKHESCPIPAAFHEKMRAAIRQAKGPEVHVFGVCDREMCLFPRRHDNAGQLNRELHDRAGHRRPAEGRRTIWVRYARKIYHGPIYSWRIHSEGLPPPELFRVNTSQ